MNYLIKIMSHVHFNKKPLTKWLKVITAIHIVHRKDLKQSFKT